MKALAVHLAKRLFRALPLTHHQRTSLAFTIFRLTGERLKHLPSYSLYQRDSLWQNAKVPTDLPADRARVFAKFFADSGSKAMLMVSHTLGGGTEQHVEDIAARLEKEGWKIFRLQRHNQDHLRLVTHQFAYGEPLFFRWPEEVPALIESLRKLGVQHLHLHHTVDLPADFLEHFPVIARGLGVAYDFTVHDYFSICPRFTLYDEAVRGYCGEPEDVRKCIACVSRFGSHIGKEVDVAAWRADYATLLAGARRVFVPDGDISQRLERYMPQQEFSVQPHPEAQSFTPLAASRKAGQPLKIVTIGGIAPHKGSHVLFECAQDALARGLPMEFHLVGHSDIDHKLKRLSNVTVSGHFQLHELPQRLKEGAYHLAYLPAVWPETYNYVLSECWRHGLYTVGLDIGAIASRIKAAPTLGRVLPLEWYLKPAKLNDALLALEIPLLKQEDVLAAFQEYPSATHDYYGM